MRISHISNSFLKIESPETRLICDPWAGLTSGGGWHSFPEYAPQDLKTYIADCDAVYISHLHSDHFDPALLQSTNLTEKVFIIKYFANQTLRRRLERLGVSQIIECQPFEIITYQDMRLVIVPQMTSNSAGLEDQIDYDLDTSIIVQAGGKTLFNQVDNPLSLDNYAHIKDFIRTHFGALDIACLAVGAASAYPQNFVGIDRDAEARRIIDLSLTRFSRIIDILKPEHFFPAGGSYIVPGRYGDLNSHIAQPTLSELENALSGRAHFHALEGQNGLDLTDLSRFAALTPLRQSKPESVAAHRSDPYPFDDLDDSAIDDTMLLDLFQSAYEAYSHKMALDGVTIGQRVGFDVYDRLRFDAHNKITSPRRVRYELSQHGPEDHHQTFHLDRRLFISCLTRRMSWNEGVPLCLYERQPNIFMPTVDFSLNYLVAPTEKLIDLNLSQQSPPPA